MDGLMEQALELMLLGMGFVLVFLLVLVATTTLMSMIINRYFPEQTAIPAPAYNPGESTSAEHGAEVSPQILAAIQQAIREHRSRRH